MLDPKFRIVTALPLQEIWDDTGPLQAEKLGDITADALKTLLREGPVVFVVANVGDPLVWIDTTQCYTFWKTEVQPYLHDASRPYMDEYPDDYFYCANEWRGNNMERLVVLEKCH